MDVLALGEAEHEVIVYCKANPTVRKVMKAMA